MKYHLLFCMILAVSAFCGAQDVITINRGQLTEDGLVSLSALDGWVYAGEEMPGWTEPDFDARTWEVRRPTRLPYAQADEQGRVQGWFRLKFRLDPEMVNEAWYFNLHAIGAARLYLNGVIYDEAGNPEPDGKVDNASRMYFARISAGFMPAPVRLDTGVQTLAIYCTSHDRNWVNHLTLRRPAAGFAVNLFGIRALENHIVMLSEYRFFQGIWLCGIVLLSFLFGVLLLLNRTEKTLQWMAILSLFLALSALIEAVGEKFASGTWTYDINDLLYYECLAIAVGLIPVTLSRVVSGHTGTWMFRTAWIIAGLYPVFWFFTGLPVIRQIQNVAMGVVLLGITILCVRMIVVHRKKLRKAEWSIVWGLIISVTWMLIHTVFINIGFHSNAYRLATVAMIYLTLPVSFLVYISIRFSDQIGMLRKNLNEISELNAEKLKAQEEKQRIIESQNVVLEKKVEERTRELSQTNSELSKAYEQIRAQRDEVISSRNNLEETLAHLKSTQAQLVHAEKMASLGELTAGIAHEIQNPLNFINNFSEVSTELIDEMHEELSRENYPGAHAIAGDIRDNLGKIHHHGKRADAIVKDMLQHSRSSGTKALTDINALCEEYLRLSYHGIRARDKSFQAALESDFDPSLEPVSVIPQDIGRVVLNLLNNAFYAVREKAASVNVSGYQPTVSVSTRKLTGAFEIRIADNGNGIPEAARDKIFQPFFTTRPTGQGTGLGLSISYEIITQGHQGKMIYHSELGKGTEFVVTIPLVGEERSLPES